MALTQSQKATIAKAQAVGGGRQGVALSKDACAYIIAVIAKDLNLSDRFPEITTDPPAFFGTQPLKSLVITGLNFIRLFERLTTMMPDVDTYFHCLATLHKARLKYERILETQPVPTIEQVGPRGLLRYGSISSKGLTALLLWRKWIYDIDNRTAQETGYAFEPIIASSIGGVPVSAKKSPVRRQTDKGKGRQVDCILPDGKAYEIKIRVTIAASGQGRWKEELEFPSDCRASGFSPVLVVLDSTPNPKLEELRKRFLDQGGEFYVGEKAWQHFHSLAGPTMSRFIDLYVHEPINALLAETPKIPEDIPELTLRMGQNELSISIAGDVLVIRREPQPTEQSEDDQLPEDIDEQVPGP
jgi:hypothetical protein